MSQITDLAKQIHQNAVDHGFWQNGTISDGPCNDAEKIALMHSELSEALEEIRDRKPPVYFNDGDPTKPEGWLVELADCLIRMLDYIEHYKKSELFESAIIDKMKYNETRPYKHGKEF